MNPIIAPPGGMWMHFAYKEFVLEYFNFRHQGRAPIFPDEPWMGYAHMDAVCVLMSALQSGRIKSFYMNDDGIIDLKPGFWRRGTRHTFIETGILSDTKICDEDENIFVNALDFREVMKDLQAGRIAEVMSGPAVLDATPPKMVEVHKPGNLKRPIPRPRGRIPKQRLRVIEEMRKLDPTALGSMQEKAMEVQFGASRDTCRQACETILSEIQKSKADK